MRVLLVVFILALVFLGPVSVSLSEESCKDNLLFASDSTALTDTAQAILRCHAAALASHPARRLRLEGHTDERGTPSYSMVMGEKRAGSARRYLLNELRMPADRIVTTSYGKERPACREHTPSCWAQNRRVHVEVIDSVP